MKIFVATYSDNSGHPYQKVFKDKKLANAWLKKQFNRDFQGHPTTFEEWCKYGAWTGKIKSYTV